VSLQAALGVVVRMLHAQPRGFGFAGTKDSDHETFSSCTTQCSSSLVQLIMLFNAPSALRDASPLYHLSFTELQRLLQIHLYDVLCCRLRWVWWRACCTPSRAALALQAPRTSAA
jgi:hypothetical protein